MRKAINLSALLFFIWLLLDAFNVPSLLLNFLLIGELPGMQTSLPPVAMLAIVSTLFGIIVFEIAARRVEIIHRTRQQIITITSRRNRLPKRRFNRA